jgi:hypothetical protein|tara:strand:+ start:466 stop:816 length:351 start_codon:yes stop_codon:yes gene_type:complete
MTSPTTTLLREWKRLSEVESTAITLRDWGELNRLLDEKSRLQGLLEDYQGKDFTEEDQDLVGNLLTVTELNRARLDTEMKTVRKQIQSEDQAVSNIRKVNQAYGGRPGENYWQTYT